MADVSVRPAIVDDAGEIARIQLDTWRTAYASILPAAVLDSLTAETATEIWREAIANVPSPRHRLVVALEQNRVVGFAAAGPAETDEPHAGGGESTVAVAPLLVEPRWGRRGHGSRLLAAVIDLARSDGFTRAHTWIPEADAASKNFYTSAGWEPDGVVRALDTGAGELREIRLHCQL